MNKLGIVCLYCVALGIKDKQSEPNIELFKEKLVLDSLIGYAKDKFSHGNNHIANAVR